MNLKTYGITLLISITSLLPIGCANTAGDTPENPILEMKITLTFADSIDTTNFRYLLAFSASDRPRFPQTPNNQYFPTPGRGFDEFNNELLEQPNGLTTYYEDFFSTWSDYMIVANNTVSLYSSDDDAFDATTTNNFVYEENFNVNPILTLSGKELIIQFQVQDLSPNDPTSIAFTFATVRLLVNGSVLDPFSDFEAGELIDVLIENEEGTTTSILINDDELFGPLIDPNDQSQENGPADIIGYQVEIL